MNSNTNLLDTFTASGWVTSCRKSCYYHSAAQLAADIADALHAKGWVPAGRGQFPTDTEFRYGPTGAISPGFRGKAEKIWIGRWIKA